MGFIMKNAGHLLNTLPSFVEDNFPTDFKDWVDTNMVSKWNAPSVNIHENETQFTVDVAAPGFKKEDFTIAYREERLIISGSTKKTEETKDDQGKFTRREFNYGKFERIFKLPSKWIETDKIGAKYEDGILSISIPRKSAAYSDQEHKIVVE